jgi:hypothetical protein
MVTEIDEALWLLNKYIIEGYDGSDIRNLLSKIASATELFLKGTSKIAKWGFLKKATSQEPSF